MNSSTLEPRLTGSEAAILGLIAAGLSTRDVAARLSISVGTVKCHLHRAFDKLDARNRLEAIAKAHGQMLLCA